MNDVRIEILKLDGSDIVADQVDPALLKSFRAYTYKESTDVRTCLYLWKDMERKHDEVRRIVIDEHPDDFATRLASCGVLVRVNNIKSYGK